MSKTIFILLLRGINVSGKNVIKMADLKVAIDKALNTDCKTYIQSGNILFTHESKSIGDLDNKISACLFKLFQTSIPIQLLTSSNLEKLIKKNPFKDASIEELHVTIVKKTDQPFTALPEYFPDEAVVIDSNIYLKCPNGYGKTKYTNTFIEKKFKTSATTRNWKTILTLHEMTREF